MNEKRIPILYGCLAALILIIAAYGNSLHNSFHFDDSHVIESNIYIRSLSNTPLFFKDAHTFSSIPANSTYRPLVSLSYAIDYAIGHGLDPKTFHTTQIILLLIVAALLIPFYITIFRLARPDGRHDWTALFCATLFAVHTGNTETMNFMSSRSELISAIGLLAAFLLYQRSPLARRSLLYLVPLAIGALAKAPVVVFAPLIYTYSLMFEQNEQATPARRRSAAFRVALPSLILGAILLIFLNSMNAKEWSSGGGSKYLYLITQPFVWLHYFRLFFFPIGLTADSDFALVNHWYDTRVIAGVLFIAAMIWTIVRTSKRRETRPIAFGLVWFAVALAPTSSIFPLAEVMNEHRLFFAYIGLVMAMAWAAQEVLLRLRKPLSAVVVTACAVLILATYAYGTHERNKAWKTEESLWTDVVAKSPGNGRAWMNFGLTQMSKGNYAGAKDSFERALAVTPNYPTLEINLGIVENGLGNKAIAEQHFLRALKLQSDRNTNFFYARWLAQVGRAPEAIPLIRKALELSPAYPDARSLLMKLYAAQGANAELRALATDTLALDPSSDEARAYSEGHYYLPDAGSGYQSFFNYGLAAIQRSDFVASAQASRAALQLNPKSADAFNNLGWALGQLGFRTEAIAAYDEALRILPTFSRAANNRQLLMPK